MNPNQKLGDKKFKAGKDNLTTGIFQWSKDYTSGASNFSEAVKLFQAAEKYDKALLALTELITCNQKLFDNWAVARNYEQMLDIYVKRFPQTPPQKLKEIADKGFHYFRMAESIDKGLQMLTRIAQLLINKGQKNEGIEILKSAYTFALEDDKSFKKRDLFNLIVQVYLQSQIFSEVERLYLDLIKIKNGVDCHQEGLVKILMIILQNQVQRAQKQMYELSNLIPAFLESNQCEVVDELIKAYKKGDRQKFMKWTTKPEITCVFPVIIIRKLREVKVPTQALKEVPAEENEAIQKLLF